DKGKAGREIVSGRVISLTPIASLRARMRKPSYFDFVNPARVGRRGLSGGGQTRFDYPQPWASTRTTQRHACLLGRASQRVESVAPYPRYRYQPLSITHSRLPTG